MASETIGTVLCLVDCHCAAEEKEGGRGQSWNHNLKKIPGVGATAINFTGLGMNFPNRTPQPSVQHPKNTFV